MDMTTTHHRTIATLESIGRTRALTDRESRSLEAAIKKADRAAGTQFVWTEDRDSRLIAMRQEGKPYAVIADALGTTVRSAQARSYRLREAGR